MIVLLSLEIFVWVAWLSLFPPGIINARFLSNLFIHRLDPNVHYETNLQKEFEEPSIWSVENKSKLDHI